MHRFMLLTQCTLSRVNKSEFQSSSGLTLGTPTSTTKKGGIIPAYQVMTNVTTNVTINVFCMFKPISLLVCVRHLLVEHQQCI